MSQTILIHLKDHSFTDETLPIINPSLLSGAEVGAFLHANLRLPTSSAYVNLTGGNPLTEYDSTPAGDSEGLILTKTSSLDTGYSPSDAFTMCAVVYYDPATGSFFLNNYLGAGNGEGILLFFSGGGTSGGAGALGRRLNVNGSNFNQTVLGMPETAQWVFVAASVIDGSIQMYCPQSDEGSVIVNSAGINIAASPNIAIGSKHYAPAYSNGTDAKVAETIIFDSQKTLAELTAIYERSKIRMAQLNGITLV